MLKSFIIFSNLSVFSGLTYPNRMSFLYKIIFNFSFSICCLSREILSRKFSIFPVRIFIFVEQDCDDLHSAINVLFPLIQSVLKIVEPSFPQKIHLFFFVISYLDFNL